MKTDLALFTFYPKKDNIILIQNQQAIQKDPNSQHQEDLQGIIPQKKIYSLNKAPLIDYSHPLKLPKAFKTKTDSKQNLQLCNVKQVIKVQMNDSHENEVNDRIHCLKNIKSRCL